VAFALTLVLVAAVFLLWLASDPLDGAFHL
jgi:hypothetical protein